MNTTTQTSAKPLTLYTFAAISGIWTEFAETRRNGSLIAGPTPTGRTFGRGRAGLRAAERAVLADNITAMSAR